jgi:hypothetical protein
MHAMTAKKKGIRWSFVGKAALIGAAIYVPFVVAILHTEGERLGKGYQEAVGRRYRI